MNFRYALLAGAALFSAASTQAANLINNGSFETGDFTGWTLLNSAGLSSPAVVIAYGQSSNYPTGAYGEAVPADNAATPAPFAGSPDGAGNYAAYFSDDAANNESLQQLTYLAPGNYEIGFDAYLTQNGYNNPNNAQFSGSIIGTQVTAFTASNQTPQTWLHFGAVAKITQQGYYNTNFSFSSFGNPAKDVVIDRIYAISTNLPSTVTIPPNPTAPAPEPASWALMLVGFGGLGATMRGRRRSTLAA